jgi:hypothetical protein
MVVVMLLGQWMKALALRFDRLTPKIESPIDESTIEFILVGVLHDDSPIADSRFTPVAPLVRPTLMQRAFLPMNNGHECPVVISLRSSIVSTISSEVADQATGTDQIGAQIASPRVFNVHGHSDMFKSGHVCVL